MAAEPLDYRAVLENTEETLVDIFREHGPVLDRSTVVDLADQRGIDRNTAGLYLGWSPVIERLAMNRYALRGVDVPAGTLEAMRGSSRRTSVQRGYGWTGDGRLWIGYTLSQAVIDSAVVGVPGSCKDELRGRFELAAPNADLGQVATDGGNLWGLARLLKRYAAEAGDALVLEFDLTEGTVYAYVGGQELLDPEKRPEHLVEDDQVDDDGAADVGTSVTLPKSHSTDSAPKQSHPDARAVNAVLLDEQLDEDESEDLPDELLARIGRQGFSLSTEEPLLVSATSGATASDGVSVGKTEDQPACVVPGCSEPGKHKLGVRCRVWYEPSPVLGKVKTSALWAPDSNAFLCDQHALGGAHITLI
jgi:hypothetical protein